MSPREFDVLVLGSGPGGYVAALRAASLGFRTALVEKDRLGGVCLNRGCIPTKSLIADAALFDRASSRGAVKSEAPLSFDRSAAMDKSRRVVSTLTKGVEQLLDKRGVEIARGRGEIPERGRIVIRSDGRSEELAWRNLVIATGSAPVFPPGLEPDGERVLSSDQVLEGGVFPAGSAAVIGGGIVGMEFACLFSMAGCTVTVVELLPDVLTGVESELKKELLRVFRKRKIRVLTDTRVEAARRSEDGVTLSFSKGEALAVDFVLVAAGRKAVLDGVDLEALGVEMNEEGRMKVDNAGLAAQSVYGTGDAAGRAPMLAHAASHQGIAAVEHMAHGKVAHGKVAHGKVAHGKVEEPAPVPSVIYTRPELASVGMGEEEAREAFGEEVKVGRFPMRALGRAHTVGATDGLVKVVADGEGRIAGVHILAEEASEMIGAGLLLVAEGMKLETLARAPMPHPTFSEGLMEAAWAALGSPIHIP